MHISLNRVISGEKQERREYDRLVELSMKDLSRLRIDNNASQGELTLSTHTKAVRFDTGVIPKVTEKDNSPNQPLREGGSVVAQPVRELVP